MCLLKPGKIVKTSKIFRIFFYIGLIIFLAACGQLDTVFSPVGTYRVSARAAAYTLDECAIVGADTPIYPYFIGSVADDPDLRGLTVFLQSTGGETISRKVQYVLNRELGENTPQTEAGGLPADSGDTGYNESDHAGSGYAGEGHGAGQDSAVAGSGESPAGGLSGTGTAGPSPAGGGLESGSPETSPPDSSGYSAGDLAPVDSASGGTADGPAADASVSLSGSSPQDPSSSPNSSSPPDRVSSSDPSSSAPPKDTPETGLSRTGDSVREGGAAESRTEVSPVDSGTGGGQRGESGGPEKPVLRLQKTTDLIVEAARMEGDLTPFLLPEGLEIGQYKLVFQVLGDQGVLNRIEKTIYYVADALFSLNAFTAYLPGGIEGSSIVPPGTDVMLEVQIAADKRLEPYVVWYNGKKRIGEGGVVRSGQDQLLPVV
jgi:hypothetical protein